MAKNYMIMSSFVIILIMATMFVIFIINPADFVLIFLSGILSLAAIVWGVRGVRNSPGKQWLPKILPMVSSPILFIALDRYPPLHPLFTGLVATLCFAALAFASSWLIIRNGSSTATEDTNIWPPETWLFILIVYMATGVCCFFPAVILINGHNDARPPLVLPGTVTQMYKTHRRNVAYYFVMNGPAGAYGSTMTTGEYQVTYGMYRNTHIGDRKCVTLHTGVLYFRWWQIGDCPGSVAPLRPSPSP